MTRKTFSMTEAEYLDLESRTTGLCLACGEERGSTEPDAERYPCDACGKRSVYGVGILLQMGRIIIGHPTPKPAPRYDPRRDICTRGNPCWRPGEPLPAGVILAPAIFGSPDAAPRGDGYIYNAAAHKKALRALPTLKALRALPKYR